MFRDFSRNGIPAWRLNINHFLWIQIFFLEAFKQHFHRQEFSHSWLKALKWILRLINAVLPRSISFRFFAGWTEKLGSTRCIFFLCKPSLCYCQFLRVSLNSFFMINIKVKMTIMKQTDVMSKYFERLIFNYMYSNVLRG